MSDRSRILAAIGNLARAFPPPEPPQSGADAAKAIDEALEKGRREGAESQRCENDRSMAEVHEQLAAALARLDTLEKRLAEEYESSMIELALEAASAIVRDRIAEGDPVAARALEQLLGSLPRGGPLRVRLNPDDLDGVRSALERDSERLQLEADPRISRGGCFVEGPAGDVDATIETAETVVRMETGA